MGKKIVMDTNIMISAFGWEGNPKEIFRKVLDKKFLLVISMEQIKELARVLNYPKFRFSEEQKARFLGIILRIGRLVKTEKRVRLIKEDPDDNVILESAENGNADFIISGDRHLLRLKRYGNARIVTASEFLDIVK